MRATSGIRLVLAALTIVGACAVARVVRADAPVEVHAGALDPNLVPPAFRDARRAPRDSVVLSRALAQLVARLQDDGYTDARARAEWRGDRDPRLVVTVDAGPRRRLASVTVLTAAREDSARFASALGLAPGAWASPSVVAAAVERAVDRAVDDGYPYAQLGVSAWDIDSTGVRVALSGGLGPKVTVTSVRFEGLKTTRPDVLLRAMGKVTGVPYRREDAEAACARLDQLGLFRRVELVGLEGDGGLDRAAMVVRVEEQPYHRFEGAVGAQGDAGIVGLANLELDNLAGTARAAGVRWESRGHGVMNFGAHYAEPLVLGLPLRLEGAIEQLVQDTLYTRTGWSARARFALSSRERVDAGYAQDRVVQPVGLVERAETQRTLFGLERVALDHIAAPRRGTAVRLEAEQTFQREHQRPSGSRDLRSSALALRAAWHRPLRGAAGLALELQAAGRFGYEGELPVYERYPVGGAATLRGYNEEEFRVDRYGLSRVEWRWFLGSGDRFVLMFWDHALMETRLAAPTGYIPDRMNRDGYGFGLQLPTPGGRAALTYGLAVGSAPIDGKIHLQLQSTF